MKTHCKPHGDAIRLNGFVVFEYMRVKGPCRCWNQLPKRVCYFHMLKGSTKSFTDDGVKLVKDKEGLLLKCGNYMFDCLPDPDSGQNEWVAVYLYPEIVRELYDKEFPAFLKDQYQIKSYGTSFQLLECNFICNLIDGLLPYFEHPEMVDPDWIKIKLKEIIQLLIKTHYGPELQKLIRELYSPADFSFKELVEAHILSSISTDELAALSNCSIANFNRKFRKLYGESPARYIRNRRLEMAAELLLATDKEISSIAYYCQFNCIAHFSTSFKLKYGSSPSQYRLKNLQKSLVDT